MWKIKTVMLIKFLENTSLLQRELKEYSINMEDREQSSAAFLSVKSTSSITEAMNKAEFKKTFQK